MTLTFKVKSNLKLSQMLSQFELVQARITKCGPERVTHICVGNLTIIGSDNVLSPDRRQAIILTNSGILLIGPLGTNFSEILIEIQTFSFKKMRLKMSSVKWRPFCLGLNVLKAIDLSHDYLDYLNTDLVYLFYHIISNHCVIKYPPRQEPADSRCNLMLYKKVIYGLSSAVAMVI